MLDAWLAEGFNVASDRVLDNVEDRISHQRQRPEWRVSWRDTHMNAYARLAMAAVIGVIAVGVIYLNLPGRNGSVGTSPSPSPSATPTSTPAALRNGVLEAGRYLLKRDNDIRAVADVPAGWQGFPDIPALISPGGDNGDGVLIGFMIPNGLFSDPCHWDLNGTGDQFQPGDVEVGPTVDELVAALRANTSYTSTSPSPVTIGSLQGTQLEIQLPDESVLTTCDREGGNTRYFIFSGDSFWDQGANNRWRLSIVDVSGTRIVVMLSYFDRTPTVDVAAGEAIVESLDFTP
jgi:hypothetical protein